MFDFYKDFSEEKISLTYLGIFNDKITDMLIELSEEYTSKKENLKKISKKTSFLIAESFQNVIRHGVTSKISYNDKNETKDFFQISVFEDRLLISSVNLIENRFVEKFEQEIEQINSLDQNQLKDFHLKLLENNQMSDKGGAGLGIIEMVRKSGLPLKKKFVPVSKDISLAILSLEVINNKENKSPVFNIENIEKLYKKLSEKNILMIYKGDFSSSSNSSILEMLNNNFLKNEMIDPANIKNIVSIIEVMQNVSKHGKKINGNSEGIFSISGKESDLFIECGNFVKKQDYQNLISLLNKIKNSTPEELEKLYKEKLSDSHLSDDDNGGLGLIEIARFTKNKFEYHFAQTPENEIFYTIKIKTV